MGVNILGYGVKSLANPSTPVTLLSGQFNVLPAGQYMVQLGKYTMAQWYDPVSLQWRNFTGPLQGSTFPLSSDGYNYRLFNASGTVVGGVVTNGGTANTAKNGIWPAGSSSTTGVTATTTAGVGAPAGTATFNCIVGGELSATVTITAAGSGYTIPPLVTFGLPPAGGLQATGVAVLTAGVVTSVTVTNQGAGYTAAATVTLTAVAGDAGTGATATSALSTANSGKLVAVTMATCGGGYATVPTITIAGLLGSPAVTAICGLSVSTATTVSSATNRVATQLIYVAQTTAGTHTTTNPLYTTGIYQVRNGMGAYNTSSSMATQVLLDGGLSQLDHANLCVATDSPAAASGTATYASGACAGITDVSFVIPI